ncbi:MAG: protein phosphatase [Pseudomonadota bacterium]
MPGLFGDLASDLAQIKRWSPAIVLSMTEQAEMDRCGSTELGSLLGQVGIDWAHLPVRDFRGLDAAQAARWPDLSGRLHSLLDSGEGVLLHCRGGKGRSGMIGLRLLVERGENPDEALKRLRQERSGAVETEEQWAWAAITVRPLP